MPVKKICINKKPFSTKEGLNNKNTKPQCYFFNLLDSKLESGRYNFTSCFIFFPLGSHIK
jgi:hypothetical protein